MDREEIEKWLQGNDESGEQSYSNDEDDRQARRNLGCNRNENHPSGRRRRRTRKGKASKKGQGCLPETLCHEENAFGGLHPPPLPAPHEILLPPILPPPVWYQPSFPSHPPCPTNLDSSRPLHPPGQPPVMFSTLPPLTPGAPIPTGMINSIPTILYQSATSNWPLHPPGLPVMCSTPSPPSELPPSLLASYDSLPPMPPHMGPPPMYPHPPAFLIRPIIVPLPGIPQVQYLLEPIYPLGYPHFPHHT